MRSSKRIFVFMMGLLISAAWDGAQGQAPTGGMDQPAGQHTVEAAPAQTDPVQTRPVHVGTAQATYSGVNITFADKSESWVPATLAGLPHVTLNLYNEHTKANQSYSGVPLITLLARLGFPDKPHGKDFRLYILAEGIDGYGVVYSSGEVTPDVHDGTVLVADAMDGKPIPGSGSGPLQLVMTGEKRPARWVRNLISIRVMKAQ